MRKKLLAVNTVSSVVYQSTTILCGLILPRLILEYYGSVTNGLINSINQFLSIIAFLDLGIGAVVQSALYKPIAENDTLSISKIISSAEKFFKRIALIFVGYIIILMFTYPNIIQDDFECWYTITLIGAMCISYFAQYYFGVVDRLMLLAAQRGYVYYTTQMLTLIINTVVCVLLIYRGYSIQTVKFITSFIYLARPFCVRIYVNKHFEINRKIVYDSEPIRQKWNGMAQHLAAIVLDCTDIIVLTIFDTLSSVSVYTVYFLVINGIKQLFISATAGVQAVLGDMWVKGEKDTLCAFFKQVEWVIHVGTTFVWGCTLMLILPFIRVYTEGISDVEYVVPLFATLITLANALHCLRLPYNLMILASGRYKETQHNYIIAAIMNLLLSTLLVQKFGLIGVTIGTLVAMIYQTVWMALYDYRKLFELKINGFVKNIFVDSISIFFLYLVCRNDRLNDVNYFSLLEMTLKTSAKMILIMGILNLIFYRQYLITQLSRLHD